MVEKIIKALACMGILVTLSACTIEKKHETIHTSDETTTTETIDIKRGKF
jgi:hypothetical protein